MKKIGFIFTAVLAAMLVLSCTSTKMSADEKAVTAGINAWNKREPEAARAYWTDIKNADLNKKYIGFIDKYNEGVKALDSTDSTKNEKKLLTACNTALTNFSALDAALDLPADVCEKGATVSAACAKRLVENGRPGEAKKLVTNAKKVYGDHADLAKVVKLADVVSNISAKRSTLAAQGKEASAVTGFDEKLLAMEKVINNYTAAENEANATAKKSGVESEAAVTSSIRQLKKDRQDFAIQREGLVRDKVYEFKNRFGEEFARQPAKGSGSGKGGALTSYDILAHYKSVRANLDSIYAELIAFAGKYPKEISQDVLDDVKYMRNDLNAKITQISREIANAEEVASRGKTVMPLMIGLFNPAPGSTAESKKSRPAKFSATGAKKDEYWWGMVSIPAGQMNDLVITMRDNRTVRVFNANTKSGKLIEKNKMKDLVSKANKVGNSWPVMNAGRQLNGTNYYFEVQKGKTDSYSGEVVVYNSFITRVR